MLLWLYITDKCDYSGVWKVNMREAAYKTQAKTVHNPGDALDTFNKNELGMLDSRPRIIPISDGKKWWVRGFIFFHFASTQTGRLLLNQQSALHARVISDLDRHGIREIFLKYYPKAITDTPMAQRREIPMPTLEQIRALPEAKNFTEAESKKFWGYWQGLGWMRGGRPIQDFSALVIEWQARDERRVEQQEQSLVDTRALRLEMETLEAKIVECQKDTETLAGFKVPSIKPAAVERKRSHKIRLEQVKAQLRQLGEKV